MIVKRKLYSVIGKVKEKSSSFIEKEKEFGRPFLGRRPLINSLGSANKGGPGFMGSNIQRPKVTPKLNNPTVSKPSVADVNTRLKSLDETINYNLGRNNKSMLESNWGNKFKTGVKTTVSGVGNTLAITGLGLGSGVAMSMASSGGNDD